MSSNVAGKNKLWRKNINYVWYYNGSRHNKNIEENLLVVDAYLVYSFIRRLTTPFDKWDAYKEGIIDAEGNILKQRKNLTKVSERQSFQLFDLLILNIKKSLSKIPGGNTRIATFAAALWLVREHDELLNKGEML